MTIDEVAREAAMSPFHFIRRFSAVFGDTPHQVRIKARLDRARLMLASGERSVTEICMEVGFSSHGSFSTLFARRVGVSPSEYRRRARSMVAVPGTAQTHLFPGCLSLMGPAFAIFEKRPAFLIGQSGRMRIKLTSILVDDQDKALRFYTQVFGFVKKHDIPVGGEYRWITVVSADGHPDVELSLEPNANPVGKTFQEGLFKQGIPATAFEVDDIDREYQRLKTLGVVFTQEPTRQGPITLAVCADTCGNLIQLYQPPDPQPA